MSAEIQDGADIRGRGTLNIYTGNKGARGWAGMREGEPGAGQAGAQRKSLIGILEQLGNCSVALLGRVSFKAFRKVE